MGRTILIVEDYDDTRMFMKFLIESYGYQVTEATDGLQAVESVKTHCPDLVLMDVSMPVMDGIAATKAIRKFKRGGDLPIIAVTAFGSRFRKKVLEAGCDDLIEKPLDFDQFKVLINKYLGV